MSVVMWEVRAAEGRLDDLVRHVDRHAPPDAQIYRADGPEPRVVVITPDPGSGRLLDVPDDLVARPPHSWRFDTVIREGPARG
jgi:hypothetical protein